METKQDVADAFYKHLSKEYIVLFETYEDNYDTFQNSYYRFEREFYRFIGANKDKISLELYESINKKALIEYSISIFL